MVAASQVVLCPQLLPVKHPALPVGPQAVVLPAPVHQPTAPFSGRLCKATAAAAASLACTQLELLRPGRRRAATLTQPV